MKRYDIDNTGCDYEDSCGNWVDADIAQELYDALRNLEVSANTVKYCYDNRPENFHRALSTLEHDAQIAREVIEKSDKD